MRMQWFVKLIMDYSFILWLANVPVRQLCCKGKIEEIVLHCEYANHIKFLMIKFVGKFDTQLGCVVYVIRFEVLCYVLR